MKEDLYEASVRVLMKTIKEIEIRYRQVLIIGHNPALSFLCEYLTEKSIGRIVPAGICIIEFQFDSWYSIQKGSGTLKVLKSPAEIILS